LKQPKGGSKILKVNYVGIVAGIIAFISLALPWWTMTMSAEFMGTKVSADVSVYPSQATASALGVSESVAMNIWFGQAALALIVITGIAAIVGSLIVGKNGKMILAVAGILALLSIIIFAVGLQSELSKEAPVTGFPKVGLFSSGSWSFMGASMNYSSYLSVGFWLALVAAILVFISLLKHPVAPPPVPPATSPAAPPTTKS
jgi:hypothetical protein